MAVKPKLLFFQWDHRAIPEFAQLHMRLHVRCLAEFFDVTVINRACDYAEECDRHEPDLVLFEAGVNYRGSRRPAISNTAANPAVPRVGLHNGDGWCEARSGFLSDMDHWGVSTFFTISTTTGEHTPTIANCTYVWPNSVDAEVHRDYGAKKVIPVMISGKVDGLYPWRERVQGLLTRTYPTLACPHHGYQDDAVTKTLYGEQYARAINASSFVAACGTVAHEFVRKHLEIPGARSCLVTEESASLAAAGFVSMQNCVFADADDILDKLDFLFRNPAELAAITASGHDLVHSRHTFKQRDQIFQWFRLQSEPQPGKIVQMGPFGPLLRVPEEAPPTIHVRGDGAHLIAIREGDRKLAAGEIEEAEVLYRRCANYSRAMPEPRLKLAWCALERGDARAALKWLRRPVEYTLRVYQADDPDPVEWALLIIITLCAGDAAGAAIQASQFPNLRHPYLDKARWAVGAVRNEPTSLVPARAGPAVGQIRASVHGPMDDDVGTWVANLDRVLSACGQRAYGQLIRSALVSQNSSSTMRSVGPRKGGYPRVNAEGSTFTPFTGAPTTMLDLEIDSGPTVRSLVQQTADKAQHLLNRVERLFGDFLPYKYSALRYHPFVRSIQQLIWDESIGSVLVLGARIGLVSAEAVLASSFRAVRSVQLWNDSTPVFRRLQRRYANTTGVEVVDSLTPFPRDTTLSDKQASAAAGFEYDLLVIASADAPLKLCLDAADRARFVVVAQLGCDSTFEAHHHLLVSRRHQLLRQDLAELGGFAIFENLALRSRVAPIMPHEFRTPETEYSDSSQHSRLRKLESLSEKPVVGTNRVVS